MLLNKIHSSDLKDASYSPFTCLTHAPGDLSQCFGTTTERGSCLPQQGPRDLPHSLRGSMSGITYEAAALQETRWSACRKHHQKSKSVLKPNRLDLHEGVNVPPHWKTSRIPRPIHSVRGSDQGRQLHRNDRRGAHRAINRRTDRQRDEHECGS